MADLDPAGYWEPGVEEEDFILSERGMRLRDMKRVSTDDLSAFIYRAAAIDEKEGDTGEDLYRAFSEDFCFWDSQTFDRADDEALEMLHEVLWGLGVYVPRDGSSRTYAPDNFLKQGYKDWQASAQAPRKVAERTAWLAAMNAAEEVAAEATRQATLQGDLQAALRMTISSAIPAAIQMAILAAEHKAK